MKGSPEWRLKLKVSQPRILYLGEHSLWARQESKETTFVDFLKNFLHGHERLHVVDNPDKSTIVLTFIAALATTLAAERACKSFRPNLLVARGYGAVVALKMRTPGIPAVFLTPTQNRYTLDVLPIMGLASFSLSKFPFTIVCHDLSEGVAPKSDSEALLQTVPEGRAILIVLGEKGPNGELSDSKMNSTLSDSEMESFLLYAYHEGWLRALGSMYKEKLITVTDTTATKENSNKSFVDQMFNGNPPPFDFTVLDLRDVVAFGTLALQELHREHENRKQALQRRPSSIPTVISTPGALLEKTIVIDPALLEDSPEPLVEMTDEVFQTVTLLTQSKT